MNWENFTVLSAIDKAIEKLKIYRSQTDGNYTGGMEFMMLIDLLETKQRELKQ